MSYLKDRSRPHLPEHLLAVLRAEFKAERRVYELFDRFFRHQTYNRRFTRQLCAMTRAESRLSWDIRQLAALMLEHQILKLPADDLPEFRLLFDELKITSPPSAGTKVAGFLLREGYTTTELSKFVIEFRRKLGRLSRVHNLIKGQRTSQNGLRDFIHLSRHECKLSLTRYLWTPEEVVERILRQVRAASGACDQSRGPHPYTAAEAELALSGLPDFETAILKLLRGLNKIYWVADSTSSRLNSLVEYPLTTIVLTIKPPGSELEFELKRAGARGEHPLNIAFRHDGQAVPIAHRFHAGSIGNLLRWEAGTASLLSKIYQAVHGVEAPVSQTVSILSVETIPVGDDEQPLLRYFTDPQIFGEGFREMRDNMAESIEAYKRERDWNPPPPADELEMTKQFLSQVGPGQAILAGTSSYRLDRLADYLSPRGPEVYFTDGLKVPYTKLEARQFADDVLEEVLGVYLPPKVSYRNHEQYLEAAFSAPENRARADLCFLSTMKEIGAFWGTLLALRSHSQGESFVIRNVGLKSRWEHGEWKVKLIFMDHDELELVGKRDMPFRPRSTLWSSTRDERHIWGGTWNGRVIKGEVEALEEIYRVGQATGLKARAGLRRALKAAYRKTLEAIKTREEVQRLFCPSFVERINDWDAIVAKYLTVRRDPAAVALWKEETAESLGKRGYAEDLIQNHLKAVEIYEQFLRAYSFLY